MLVVKNILSVIPDDNDIDNDDELECHGNISRTKDF
jgi:hypothetical protein